MNKLVDIALKYEGFPAVKYIPPGVLGNNPEAFDCSGFVQWVILESGIVIPNVPGNGKILRHSEEFFDFLGYQIHEPARNPGDLIFFSKNGICPTHLGIYIGDDQMIHSPGKNGGKVNIRSIGDYCKRPIKFDSEKGFPKIYFQNPIGYKRIAMPSDNRYRQRQ